MLSCLFFYLEQLPTVVFSNARFVMLMFVRAGMCPTRASVKIVSFSLDLNL